MQALRAATEPHQPLILLATHRLLGELATEAQQFGAASSHLDQSLALADACGALYERALTPARGGRTARGDGHPRGGARTATQPGRLTQREIDVLRLLAAGYSNREIGDALSMSVRTAERHINNIYNKINARGRADATAFALRHDLADPTSP